MKQNWKTTSAGIAAILVAVGSALKALTDNDPTTVADIGACIAAIMAGVGLILAKDAAKAD
jgi:hypothetical protein